MKIEFLFVGKTTDPWIQEGCENYIMRIARYVKMNLLIINSPKSLFSQDILKSKEAALVHQRLSGKDFVIILDEKGKQFTSKEFAVEVNKLITGGKAKIVFVVAGAYGSDASLLERADLVLSFSKLTFTHQMIRLLLLEQVYRAFTILRNEKYHH